MGMPPPQSTQIAPQEPAQAGFFMGADPGLPQ
jgi:hypothetical protein